MEKPVRELHYSKFIFNSMFSIRAGAVGSSSRIMRVIVGSSIRWFLAWDSWTIFSLYIRKFNKLHFSHIVMRGICRQWSWDNKHWKYWKNWLFASLLGWDSRFLACLSQLLPFCATNILLAPCIKRRPWVSGAHRYREWKSIHKSVHTKANVYSYISAV